MGKGKMEMKGNGILDSDTEPDLIRVVLEEMLTRAKQAI